MWLRAARPGDYRARGRGYVCSGRRVFNLKMTKKKNNKAQSAKEFGVVAFFWPEEQKCEIGNKPLPCT